LLIVDLRLPGIHASDLCRSIREFAALPILVVADSNQEYDELACLEAGADDYVMKGCSNIILLARIRALLRRRDSCNSVQTVVTIGNLTLDLVRLVARCKGDPIALTPTEFRLLKTLADSQGRTLSREKILQEVWESAFVADKRLVDTHIRNLRRKIQTKDCGIAILTVRGTGYRLSSLNNWSIDKVSSTASPERKWSTPVLGSNRMEFKNTVDVEQLLNGQAVRTKASNGALAP